MVEFQSWWFGSHRDSSGVFLQPNDDAKNGEKSPFRRPLLTTSLGEIPGEKTWVEGKLNEIEHGFLGV